MCQALARSWAEGNSACATLDSALGPTGKAHSSRDRGGGQGAHNILAVAWQGKYLERGTARSCSCSSGGASALPEGDSGGNGKGSYSQADPPVCTHPLCRAHTLHHAVPSLAPGSLWAAEIHIQVHPGRFGAVIPQDVTSTGSGAHRFGDSSVPGEDTDLCPVQTE